MKNPKAWLSPLSTSVQGLVLLNRFVIWNPTTRRFFNLPKPKTRFRGRSFLGYDPLEGKHKLLHVDQYSESAWIITLGAQESWRIISKGICCSFGQGRGRCFNGILYYSAFVCTPTSSSYRFDYRIVSFDVSSEKFNLIKPPPEVKFSLVDHYYMMIPYEGRLALVSPNTDDKVDLYILKDADGHKWTHKYFPIASEKDKREGRTCYFRGVTDAGELIFAPCSFSESVYILYFDPMRSSIREVLFEGIVGDEFRSHYGLGDHEIRELVVFPNHFESLVSSL